MKFIDENATWLRPLLDKVAVNKKPRRNRLPYGTSPIHPIILPIS